VSLRYAMPVAAFDVERIATPVEVRFATGTERFTDLVSDDVGLPDPGEVVFVDREGVVVARRWCWRQSRQSATGAATTRVLFVVEGHHEAAERDVAGALADLTALLHAHQPGCRATAYRLTPAGNGDGRA